jgi:hypothetical protein
MLVSLGLVALLERKKKVILQHHVAIDQLLLRTFEVRSSALD